MNLYITIIFSIFEFMIDSITNLIDQYIEYIHVQGSANQNVIIKQVYQQILYNKMVFLLKSTLIALTAVLIVTEAACGETLHKPVHPFAQQQADLIFKKYYPAVLVLLGEHDEKNSLFEIAAELSPQYPNILFTYSKKGEDVYLKLIQLVGTHRLKAPNLLYFSDNRNKYLYKIQQFGEYSLLTVKNFIGKAQQNSIQQFLKSRDSTEDMPKNYIEINKKYLEYHNAYTFRDALKNSQKQYLVDLYAFWCPYSQQFNLEMLQLAKRFDNNQNIIFAKIDASQNDVKGFQITGYPTVLFYGKDRSNPSVFSGIRSSQQITNWIKSLTSYPWVQPHIAQKQINKVETVQNQQKQVIESKEQKQEPQNGQKETNFEQFKEQIKQIEKENLQQL